MIKWVTGKNSDRLWYGTTIKDGQVEAEPPPDNVQELAQKLLAVGGKDVSIEKRDPDTDKLIEKGVEFSTSNREFVRGFQVSWCHKNVTYLYDKGLKIATGYALLIEKQTNIWIPHSWGIGCTEEILETTLKFRKYFGFILNPEEAETFYWENM